MITIEQFIDRLRKIADDRKKAANVYVEDVKVVGKRRVRVKHWSGPKGSVYTAEPT